jgi:transcriptional regulator with XRE-family HTH domain
MTGHTPWRELKHKATPEQVDRARRELEQALTLGELRKARELTQAQLAEALDTTQPGISAIERRTDLYVSTLRSYVEALGGHLQITAVFPDGAVPIMSFADLGERTIEYGVQSFDIESGIVRVIWRHLRERYDAGDEAAGQLADEFEPLAAGRIPALTMEPGTPSVRVLFDVICLMNPPAGRANPPFAQFRSALEADVAVRST